MIFEACIEMKENTPIAAQVAENLALLYATREGEQPLDREFGLSTDFLNLPMPAARAQLSAQIIRKTSQYESRARVVKVEWEDTNAAQGKLCPKVVVELGEY